MEEHGVIGLKINGRAVNCAPGTSILDAALQNGIPIPNLCHHPDLKPFGACRLCLVEDEKSGRLMAACVTPAAQDMAVVTESERVSRHRRNIVRLMIAEHPESCILCNKGNRCRLRELAARLNVGEADLYPMPNYKPIEQANPFITRDLSKCILCGKCIRADHELVVVGAIDYIHRGFRSRPAASHESSLEESNCTFCGTCVSICPTGALMARQVVHVGTPQREARSICGFCGVGCAVRFGVTYDRIVEASPAGERDSANRSTLCVRGHFGIDFFHSPDRLSSPLIRKEGQLAAAPWDEALDAVAKGLLEIKRRYGPQSLAFFGSSKCTNEENYLFQKMARTLLETNNVDNGGSLWGGSASIAHLPGVEGGLSRRGLAALEGAELVMVLGADPCFSSPVLGYHLKRAARKGVPIILVDPRKTELVPFAALWLAPLPQTDLQLVNGIASLLLDFGGVDVSSLKTDTQGFAAFREALSAYDLQEVCRATGLDRSQVSRAAEWLVGKRISLVVGSGILQQRQGQKTLEAIYNLALMTGSLGEAGGGILIPTRENNQAGAWHMGSAPETLPGGVFLRDDEVRRNWERVWGIHLSPDPGLGVVRMIEEAEKGTLKALYVMGENPLRALPQKDRVRKALENLELLVVQDIFSTETAALAHVVLPGAACAEKAGTFTNMEGMIQHFDPAIPPPPGAKPDWEILDLLGKRMGYPRVYGDLRKVRSEISQHVPLYASLAVIAERNPARSPADRARSFSGDPGQTRSFFPVSSCSESEADEEYPFTAILGSSRFQLGSGTRTGRSRCIEDFGLKGEVEVSREDAERLGLKDGERVEIRSRHGALIREMRVDRYLRRGLVHVPLAFDGNGGADLLPLTDLHSPESPGTKHCRIGLRKMV